jgi:hypothetical protein
MAPSAAISPSAIGRRQINRDFLGWQRQPRGVQRGLHPLAAFRHCLVGQADNVHADLSRRHHHLDVDRHRVDAFECNRTDPCNHLCVPSA